MAKGHGGKRSGAGRPKGAKNKKTLEMEALLDDNKELILNKAIALATHRTRPNTTVLTKLVDKILPSLSSADIKADVKTNDLDMSEAEIKSILKKLLKEIS